MSYQNSLSDVTFLGNALLHDSNPQPVTKGYKLVLGITGYNY